MGRAVQGGLVVAASLAPLTEPVMARGILVVLTGYFR